jgi:hypothetical protein
MGLSRLRIAECGLRIPHFADAGPSAATRLRSLHRPNFKNVGCVLFSVTNVEHPAFSL